MSVTPKAIIFVGRSGSGKGTQAALLNQYFTSQQPPVPHYYLETGASLRQLAASDSLSGRLAKEAMLQGFLPAFLAIRAWANLFVEHLSGVENLIIDGTPRTTIEADALDTALKFYHYEQPIILDLEVPREVVTARLKKRGRYDDTDEAIVKRLNAFDRQVLPIIEFYKTHPGYRYCLINGDRSIEDIQKEILSLLT
jgi:adenylate kinase